MIRLFAPLTNDELGRLMARMQRSYVTTLYTLPKDRRPQGIPDDLEVIMDDLDREMYRRYNEGRLP